MTNKTQAFFTIVAKNYVSYAITLCNSIQSAYQNARIYIIFADGITEDIRDIFKDYNILTDSDLELPDIYSFRYRYSVMEYSTALKPFAFLKLFKLEYESVIYLDPDIYVLNKLIDIDNAFHDHYSVVLTPHLLSPIRDSCEPGELDIMRVGVFNLGFIAIKNTAIGRSVALWWSEKLEYQAYVGLDEGLFTDQKWVDLVPCMFSGVLILRDPTYNLAYWNLQERLVTVVDDEFYVDGNKLKFIHFSGVDPTDKFIFSKHQNRFNLSNIGQISSLYEKYVNLLDINGYTRYKQIPYSHDYQNNGKYINRVKRIYWRNILDNSNKNVTIAEVESDDFWNQVEPNIINNIYITRYMHACYLSRAEYKKFGNLDITENAKSYARFFIRNAHTNNDDDIYVNRSRALLKQRKSISIVINQFLLKLARAIYFKNKNIIVKISRRFPNSIVNKVKRVILGTPIVTDKGERVNKLIKQPLTTGVSLIGYAKGDFGVSQNLHSLFQAIKNNYNAVNIYSIDAGNAYVQNNIKYEKHFVDVPSLIQIICVNADQTQRVIDELDIKFAKPTRRIGIWFWELEDIPDEWVKTSERLDEIWAPSYFIENVLKKKIKIPVHYVPVAVNFEYTNILKYNFNHSQFKFFTNFDFNSYLDRKNAMQVIEEFSNAFNEDSNSNALLIIKCVNKNSKLSKFNKLQDKIKGNSKIILIDDLLSRDEMYSLINQCDCYISLHRSEGFGLGLAEAMLMGKIVIATGYSGNMTFMNSTNSILIDFDMLDVEDKYPNSKNLRWASPKAGIASQHMKTIISDRSRFDEMRKNARISIIENHSNNIVYARVNELLNLN
jgi:hypothetical protein